jgi:hypothetical protein
MTLLGIMSRRLRTYAAVRLLRLAALLGPWIFCNCHPPRNR